MHSSLFFTTAIAIIIMVTQPPAFCGGPDPRESNTPAEPKSAQAGFRAVGNEPGWHLEIRDQAQIILVTNYGSEEYAFDLPDAETDTVAKTTRYQVKQAGQEMTLTISAETCQDSMSGEEFSSKVEVVYQGKTLQGCGQLRH